MKRYIIAALTLVAAFLGQRAGANVFAIGTVSGTCQQDEEIAPPLRATVDNSALGFVTALLGPHPETAHSMMTTEAQAAVDDDTFLAHIRPTITGFSPFDPPTIARTYYVQSIGVGPNTRALCGLLANNAWVSVEIKPGVAQAHVVVASRSRNNDWAFTLWLLREAGQWRVQYFYMSVSSVVGLSPQVLLEQARRERDQGHAFNADLLYVAARTVSNRGPSFQLGVQQSLTDDARTFTRPAELSGDPPRHWVLQGSPYTVSEVQVTGVSGHLGLIFVLPQTNWPSDHDADLRNRAFINAFIATHPDYSRAFHFLIARALRPDGAGGFGTVYEDGVGFQ